MHSTELDRAWALERALRKDLDALVTPQQFRARFSRFMGQFSTPEDVHFEPVMAGKVPVEWMIPGGVSTDATVLHLHGGGYMLGSPIDYREMLPRIARASGARGLAVDYRCAPEHPCPAAVEDAVAAYRWLLSNGGRPERTVIAGDSAGGGLTVATLVAIRDQGLALPAGGVCISPWVDLEASGASIEGNAAVDPFIDRHLLLQLADGYLQGQDPRNPVASPLHADLRGLPPLLIQVGGIEVLLDDAKGLADRVTHAGGDVVLEVMDDVPHVWHWFGSFLPEARKAVDGIGAFARSRLSR